MRTLFKPIYRSFAYLLVSPPHLDIGRIIVNTMEPLTKLELDNNRETSNRECSSGKKMSADTTEITKVDDGGGSEGPAADTLRRELEEQFNVQRARMKDLFLQKEEDMQRSQLEKEQLQSEVLGLRAELQQLQTLSANQQSEIQSLQMLVSETVEVSSSGSEEIHRLRARCHELDQALQQLRHQLTQQQQEVSLAPATFVRSLARKLVADTDEQPPRKNVEDGELMQSLIQPLEAEIAALKNKLRDTDTQLQHALKTKATPETGSQPGGDSKPETEGVRQCDMCVNYEKQLVAEQAQANSAREQASRLQSALKMATEELEGVRSIHDETVRSWQADRAESAQQLDELKSAVESASAALGARSAEAEAATRRAIHTVTTLTVQRETLQGRLDMLERDNAILMGQYTQKAAEMQNEIINLPDTIEALQELTLQLREELISCCVGKERAAQGELALRAQLVQQAALLARAEDEAGHAAGELTRLREELEQLQTEREQMKELGDKLRQSNDMNERLLDDKKRLQTEVSEVRQRVYVLQQELDNSERVQQDFVRLSQSLQVQLQRIREADSEVRWQFEEDVNECPSCHVALNHIKKKVHCRHCGRIFCPSCVPHAVPCGPRAAPARVCAVCRTLLQPHTAPYFSTHPPQTPG